MNYDDIINKMDKTVGVFENNLAEVRAGRANPAILNKIKIDYYGVSTPISQVAGISVPEARLIVIQPWDLGILKEIEKEILKSDIGINPNNDGKVIRLSFPELNEERRKEIVKNIKKMAEESKIAVRSIRRDGIEEFKKKQKDSEITEDELRIAEEEIQKIEWKAEENEKTVSMVITTEEKTDIREKLFYMMADAKMPILNMQFTKVSLEDIFLELTQNETAPVTDEQDTEPESVPEDETGTDAEKENETEQEAHDESDL